MKSMLSSTKSSCSAIVRDRCCGDVADMTEKGDSPFVGIVSVMAFIVSHCFLILKHSKAMHGGIQTVFYRANCV